MAEEQVAVKSEVIVPEPTESAVSPQTNGKRRQSSIAEISTKRPRLKREESQDSKSLDMISKKGESERRKSGQLEERKRGQRLFGALLDTLSQSSSSAANKRRTDIEKKQQAKLKLQAEEDDEKRKQQLDVLTEIRRREHKKYDKQSMQIRHSNLLACAQFLRTKAEPQLYYKPWELLPGDQEKIASQIKDAETLIEHETLDQRHIQDPGDPSHPKHLEADLSAKQNGSEDQETVGPTTNQAELDDLLPKSHANANSTTTTNDNNIPQSDHDISKDNADDGGEVVLEADEDTVIY